MSFLTARRHGRSAWARQLDFVGPRPVTAWWSWAVLGLGMLAALGTFDAFDKVRREQDDTAAHIRRLERADRRARLVRAMSIKSADEAASSASAGAQPPALSGRSLAEASALGLLVGYPWGQALAELETQSTSRQAVLMGASVSLDNLSDRAYFGATWRVQAAVKDDAAALAWVASMPQGQLLSRERLAQPFDAPTGRYDFKVNAQMQWPGSETKLMAGKAS